MRRYGFSGETFTLEAGHRAGQASGLFIFKACRGANIRSAIESKMKAIRESKQTGNSTVHVLCLRMRLHCIGRINIFGIILYLVDHRVPLSSQRHLRSAERNLLHVLRYRLDTYTAAGPSPLLVCPPGTVFRTLCAPRSRFRAVARTFLFALY